MKLNKIAKCQAIPALGPYLPGLDGVFAAPPASPPLMDQDDWWVWTSAKQILNADGHPAGFRHKLMRGNKTIKRGTGPDARRTFLAHANFMNRAHCAARSNHLFTTQSFRNTAFEQQSPASSPRRGCQP